MRVLHALRSDGFAGVERHIATLAVAQAQAGHEVTVIGGDTAKMRSAFGSAQVVAVPGNTVAEVINQVRRNRSVDIVHAHMTAAELAASLASRSPIVATRHFARRRGTTPVGRLAGTLVRRRVRTQIAISAYVAEAVDGSATVIHPGVAPDYEPPRARRRVILIAQRLQREKNTDVALRIFAGGAPDDWALEIVGRGPELPALRSLAHELGVGDRVSFLGFRDDVPELMRTSSVLLAPCEVEGLGLSVLEAMSHALPVVASRAGAHPETVGAADGARLFSPGDPHEGAFMLADLLADPTGRDAYGSELARVQRERFTPTAQAAATDEIYRAVLS